MFLGFLLFHVCITEECTRNNKCRDVGVEGHSHGTDGMVTPNGGKGRKYLFKVGVLIKGFLNHGDKVGFIKWLA
jgi:hypothetical protein